MSSSKHFADFVVSLNNEIKEVFNAENSKVANDEINNILTRVNNEVRNELNKHCELGASFHTQTYGMILDIVGNYLFMDTVRVCSKLRANEEQLAGVLINRSDMIWAYFRQILDSVPAARGLVEDAARRETTEGAPVEGSSPNQGD